MPPAVYTREMSIRPRQDAAPIPAFPALGVFLSKLLAPPNEPDTSFCPKARRLGFSFARLFFFFHFQAAPSEVSSEWHLQLQPLSVKQEARQGGCINECEAPFCEEEKKKKKRKSGPPGLGACQEIGVYKQQPCQFKSACLMGEPGHQLCEQAGQSRLTDQPTVSNRETDRETEKGAQLSSPNASALFQERP